MTVESQPLVALQQKETSVKAQLTAFGQIQSAVSSFQDAVNALRIGSAFSSATATVSGDAVTATTSTGASTGSYAVSVTQLARAQSMASAPVATADTSIGSGNLTIKSADGTTVLATLSIGSSGSGTLSEVRDKINAANIGVKASLVNDGGQVRLVLNASKTGAANAFQVSADAGLTGLTLSQTQPAQDASYSVNGLPLTSASNVITDAVPGVTLTLSKQPPAGSPPGTTVDSEVDVALDTSAVTAAAQKFVTAYNSLNTLIGNLTNYDPNTKTAAVLNGESTVRRLQDQVRTLVTGTKTGGAPGDLTSLSQVGISIQKDGSLALDTTKFSGALSADASKVSALFTATPTSTVATDQGFAVQLSKQLSSILGPDGLLDARQQGLQSSIRDMDQQQADMQSHLALTQQRLTAQYAALDALVSTRQQQSTALANALAGLPTVTSK
jgi:flagellar hook-associated protein 2